MADMRASTSTSELRDPATRRISLFGTGVAAQATSRLVRVFGRSPLAWRLNFSVSGRYGDRRLKIPVIFGRGYQNLSIGEPWLLRMIAAILQKRQGAFVDVGVNLGQTLIKVKLADWERRYFGFEPNPQCYQYATELAAINRFPACTLFPVGLSDADAIATLWAKDDAVDPSASLVPGFRAPHRYTRTVPVPVFRGDDVLGDLRDLAVVKIDVEGGELDVVRGLERTLRRFQPFIVCEILPVFDETSDIGRLRKRRQDALVSILHDVGYSIFRVHTDGTAAALEAIETHDDMSRTNYVMVPAGETASFPAVSASTRAAAVA